MPAVPLRVNEPFFVTYCVRCLRRTTCWTMNLTPDGLSSTYRTVVPTGALRVFFRAAALAPRLAARKVAGLSASDVAIAGVATEESAELEEPEVPEVPEPSGEGGFTATSTVTIAGADSTAVPFTAR